MIVSMRPAIGAKDLVYAVLNESSDAAGGTPLYGTVKSLAGLGKISINPNGNAAVLYGDDQALHVADSIGKGDVTLELADIDPAAEAEILGHTYVNGGILKQATDQSPYVAIGFKTTRTGSNVATYVWLYKCKFIKPDNADETKKESVSLRGVSLKGVFMPLIATGAWQLKVRTDDPNVSANLLSNFFNSVVLSAGIDLGALTLTSGVGNVATKTITLTFAKAGGGSTKIANPNANNIIAVLDSSKTILTPVSFTAGSPSASPTVAIVYTSLTAAAHTIVVTAELQDANGVACVAKSIAVTPA